MIATIVGWLFALGVLTFLVCRILLGHHQQGQTAQQAEHHVITLGNETAMHAVWWKCICGHSGLLAYAPDTDVTAALSLAQLDADHHRQTPEPAS